MATKREPQGSPAGWRVWRVGGVPLQLREKPRSAAVWAPLHARARIAPDLWEHCPGWRRGHYGVKGTEMALLGTLSEPIMGKTIQLVLKI